MTAFSFFVAEIPRGPGQRPGASVLGPVSVQLSGRMPDANPTDASRQGRPE